MGVGGLDRVASSLAHLVSLDLEVEPGQDSNLHLPDRLLALDHLDLTDADLLARDGGHHLVGYYILMSVNTASYGNCFR